MCQPGVKILVFSGGGGVMLRMLSVPRHVFAGLPPREASNRAWMGQVHKGKGQLSLATDAGLWRRKEPRNTPLPFTGVVPDL